MKKYIISVAIGIIVLTIIIAKVVIGNTSSPGVDKKVGTYESEYYSFAWSSEEFKFKVKSGCPIIEKKNEDLVYSFAVIDYTDSVESSDAADLIAYGMDKLKTFYKKYPVDIGHTYAYGEYPELFYDREYTTIIRGGFGSSGFDKTGFHHEMYIIQENGKTLIITIGFDGDSATVEKTNTALGEKGVINYFRDVLDSIELK